MSQDMIMHIISTICSWRCVFPEVFLEYKPLSEKQHEREKLFLVSSVLSFIFIPSITEHF
jgi:hypothetical protein